MVAITFTIELARMTPRFTKTIKINKTPEMGQKQNKSPS